MAAEKSAGGAKPTCRSGETESTTHLVQLPLPLGDERAINGWLRRGAVWPLQVQRLPRLRRSHRETSSELLIPFGCAQPNATGGYPAARRMLLERFRGYHPHLLFPARNASLCRRSRRLHSRTADASSPRR